jgi:hypothetical protein
MNDAIQMYWITIATPPIVLFSATLLLYLSISIVKICPNRTAKN